MCLFLSVRTAIVAFALWSIPLGQACRPFTVSRHMLLAVDARVFITFRLQNWDSFELKWKPVSANTRYPRVISHKLYGVYSQMQLVTAGLYLKLPQRRQYCRWDIVDFRIWVLAWQAMQMRLRSRSIFNEMKAGYCLIDTASSIERFRGYRLSCQTKVSIRLSQNSQSACFSTSCSVKSIAFLSDPISNNLLDFSKSDML